MLQILFAFLGGVFTVAAPCILPVLPIILGSSVGQRNKSRPLFIVLGFVVTFALVSVVLSIIARHIAFLSPDHVRTAAIVLIGIFGLFLIWPLPFEWLTTKFSGLTNSAASAANKNGSALLLGMVLGLVWAPCAGPILASILALIAIQGNTARSLVLLLAYALGAGLPMLVIAYGGQYITTKIRSIAKYSQRLQQIFGVLIVLLAVAMYFQYDTIIEKKLAGFFPQSGLENRLAGANNNYNPSTSSGPEGNSMEKIAFQNFGPAPDFAGISHWLNSNPLTIQQLKGKVVLVDFWTYSCINCIRTLPYVTKWYDQYKDKGLVVVGVHTPEFAFEKVTDNVQTAIGRFNIHYPVAQDNDYGTWQAYQNQYWPAEYLIDQKGNIVYQHFGEGNYDHTENAIRQLLGIDQGVNNNNDNANLSKVQSPEMYFEPSRLEYLTPDQAPSVEPKEYTFTQNLALNNFALSGNWKFENDHATLNKPDGKIRLHFSSGKIFMVAAADSPITLKITVDGKTQPDVTVQMSQLYTLFDSSDYSGHVIEIDIPDAGFQAFTFTFG